MFANLEHLLYCLANIKTILLIRPYANSVDPDQTALSGAVWSRATLFAIPLSILKGNATFNLK